MEFIEGCKVTEVDKMKEMGLKPADVSICTKYSLVVYYLI